MNTYRRLLAATLVALACVFAIQPAGAITAQVSSSDENLCSVTGPMPENFPTWLEVQLRADDDCLAAEANANLIAADASLQPLCVNNAPLPDSVPTWIVVRELANNDCLVEAPDANAGQVPIEGSIVAMNEQPGSSTGLAVASTGESNVQDLGHILPGETGPTA